MSAVTFGVVMVLGGITGLLGALVAITCYRTAVLLNRPKTFLVAFGAICILFMVFCFSTGAFAVLFDRLPWGPSFTSTEVTS